MKTRICWQVSLSTGETFFENKGRFEEIAGELSPWQKLQKYLAEAGAEITSLSLFTEDGRTFNLPSAGKNPKFQEFTGLEKPIDFQVWRKLASDICDGKVKIDGNSEFYTVAEAVYPDYKLQLWVDELNIRNCWVLVVGREND